MPSDQGLHRAPRRLIAIVAAASLGFIGATTTVAPAAASTVTTKSTTSGDHRMGSQIRKHEKASTSAKSSGFSAMASSSSVLGLDVSKWDGTVNWKSRYKAGRRFVWVKATEGTSYKSATFSKQYKGSAKAGLIRGAYHFALPNKSSGTTQAKYFSSHGGGWSADGITLPGAVDLEYNPYGSDCYGLSKTKMRTWITSFRDYYKKRWHKYPAIYTSTSWWTNCVGSKSYASTDPLWVAKYSSKVGSLPYKWKTYTVWQYNADSYDKDRFNGSLKQLKKLAKTKD